MRIGICDDDASALEWIAREIRTYMDGEAKPFQLFSFQSGEGVQQFLKKGTLDLIFMDINMGEGQSGIEIAAQLSQLCPACSIAFLTNYLEYATDVYETRHCYFIIKTELQRRLPFVIRKARERQISASAQILLSVKGAGSELVEKRRILYLERQGRTTHVFLDDGTVLDTSERLDSLYDRLGSAEFVRCHNSFVIRLEKVREYSRMQVVLEGGQEISISRPYIDVVKKALVAWSWRSGG